MYKIIRTDAPAKTVTEATLEDAMRRAETIWERAHYTDKPSHDITDRTGAVVAWQLDGKSTAK